MGPTAIRDLARNWILAPGYTRQKERETTKSSLYSGFLSIGGFDFSRTGLDREFKKTHTVSVLVYPLKSLFNITLNLR